MLDRPIRAGSAETRWSLDLVLLAEYLLPCSLSPCLTSSTFFDASPCILRKASRRAKSMQVHDAQRGAIPRSAPAAGRSDRPIPNDRGPQWHSQRSPGAAGWRLTSRRNSHQHPRIVPLMRRQRSTALELLRSCLIVMLRMAKVAIRLD